jgi:hypothetical protein
MLGRNFQKAGAEVARTVSDERAFDGWFFLLWIEHQQHLREARYETLRPLISYFLGRKKYRMYIYLCSILWFSSKCSSMMKVVQLYGFRAGMYRNIGAMHMAIEAKARDYLVLLLRAK